MYTFLSGSIRSGKLKVVKRKASNERIGNVHFSLPCSTSLTLSLFKFSFFFSSAVFGQPLATVLDQDKSRTVTSPTHLLSPSTPYQSLVSPPPSSSQPPNNSSNNTLHLHPVSARLCVCVCVLGIKFWAQ